MKTMITALLCLSASLSAKAAEVEFKFGPDRDRRNGPNVEIGIDLKNGGIEFRRGDDGFVPWNNDLYVPTARECNLKSVYIGVRGGDVEINDLDVVFGNGERQDIRVREYFREGSYSNEKALRGGKRCIVGFKIDANTLNRWRGSRARVTLYAEQVGRHGRVRDIELGSVRIDEYFNRREWHGRWGGRDGRGWGNDRKNDKPQICINGFCFTP